MDAKCPTCGQVIAVDDTATGRIGWCPACKGLYEVASAGRLRAVGTKGRDGAGGAASGAESDVRYKCAKCKTVLESSSALAGREDKCPICGHSNVVPAGRRRKKVKRQEELVFLEAGAQEDDSSAGTASEQDENVFGSNPVPDLQVAVGDGKVGRAPEALGVDAQDASEVPMAADEAIGERTDREHVPADQVPPADMPGEPQWFYVSGGEQVGPVSFGVVRDLVRTGHLQASSMVWREGMDRWAQLGTTPEFCDMPTATMSQPPTVQQLPVQRQEGLSLHRQRIAIACAAGVGMIATFLPWVKAPIVGTVDGTAGDGWITFGLYAVALIVAFVGDRRKLLSGGKRLGAIIPAALASLIGIWKIVDFRARMSDVPKDNPFAEALAQTVQLGVGLYLVVIAGIVVVIFTFVFKNRGHFRPSAQ